MFPSSPGRDRSVEEEAISHSGLDEEQSQRTIEIPSRPAADFEEKWSFKNIRSYTMERNLAAHSRFTLSEAASKHKTVVPKNVRFLVHPAHATAACCGLHPLFLDIGHQSFSG